MSEKENDKKTAANDKADLEVKDAQLIFSQVWKQLEKDFGRENLRFPEIMWLGGALGPARARTPLSFSASAG